MASENVLAREVIELLVKGAKKAEQEIDNLKKKLKEAENAQKKLSSSLESFGKFASRGMVAAGAALTALTRSGLQGTVQGEALAMAYKGLATEVATGMLPIVRRLTEVMEDMSKVARPIASFFATEMSASMDTYGGAIKRVIDLTKQLNSATGGGLLDSVKMFQKLFAGGGGPAGAGLNIFSKMIDHAQNAFKGGAGGLWEDAIKSAKDPKKFFGQVWELFKKDWGIGGAGKAKAGPGQELTPLPSKEPSRGFEKPEDTFKRIQLAALGMDYEKQILDELKKMRQNQEKQMGGGAPGAPPAVGP